MSMYTPVFPPPVKASKRPPTPNSSMSTVAQETRVADPDALSEFHLALASLPYELCPSSRPSSPQSSLRVEALQTKIERALTNDTYINDFVNLRCTRRGAVPQLRHEVPRDDEDISYILPDTEEEWFEWEKMVAERRLTSKPTNTKGKGKMKVKGFIAADKTLPAQEKVANWREALVHADADADAPSLSSPSHPQPTKIGPPYGVKKSSTLPFRVVKGSRALTGKPKARSLQTANGDPKPKQVPEGDVGESSRKPEVQTSHPSHAKRIEVDLEDLESQSHSNPIIQPPVSDVAVGKETLPDVSGFSSFLPPSFHGLSTSTPQPSHTAIPDFGIEFRDGANEAESVTQASQSQPQAVESQATVPQNVFPSSPPSTPAASSSPPRTPSGPTRATSMQAMMRQADEDDVQILEFSSSAPVPQTPQKISRERPLTPPPERADLHTYHVSPQNLRTPERQPLKKSRTAPMLNGADSLSSPESMQTKRHADPAPRSPAKTLGNAKSLPIPRTPDGRVISVPTLTDLLATSRRSKPRPRPPSRKSRSASAGDSDIDPVTGEPSPAKSYLSSPASGSSAESTPASTKQAPQSPMSPLFTQNPSAFAPAATSTQVEAHSPSPLFTQNPSQFAPVATSTQIPHPPSPLERFETMHPRLGFGAFASRPSSQIVSGGGFLKATGSTLTRASSGLLGMAYSSQFDVEGQVDKVSDFLEKDVDFDAWVNVDDDADEVEVLQIVR
ncbi:hypothetical protein BD410DRAFT_900558 [Rickenella mellea]|uniref:Uncharacterized protein n=1 Tax=Rickenella mellea TaxID=50990 RepID=A0A4Y7PV34_9AGAM|nr:hypothetical protein BD410DRAFT_900558 [Rickenella mellea]